MSSLITYKGLQLLSPTPTKAGGQALNDNFTSIADSLDTKITTNALNASLAGLTVSSIQGVEDIHFDANVDHVINVRYSTDEGSGVLLTFHDSFTNTDTLTMGGNYISTASGTFSGTVTANALTASSITANGTITTAVGGVSALKIGANNGTPLLNGGVVGNYNYAGAVGSTAVGFYNNANGGTVNTTTGAVTGTVTGATTGKLSTAFGARNKASGDFSTAVGYNNTASGSQSAAIGYNNTASAGNAVALGFGVTASSTNSTRVGWGSVNLIFDPSQITATYPIVSNSSITGDLWTLNYGSVDGNFDNLWNSFSSLGDMAYQNSGSVYASYLTADETHFGYVNINDGGSISFSTYNYGSILLSVYDNDLSDYRFTLDDGGNLYASSSVQTGNIYATTTQTTTAQVMNLIYYGGTTQTAINVQAPLSFSGASLTGSTSGVPQINITQTWNTTGNPTLIKANVTKTAAGSSSKLLDLQIGGVSRLQLDTADTLTIGKPGGTGTSSDFAMLRVNMPPAANNSCYGWFQGWQSPTDGQRMEIGTASADLDIKSGYRTYIRPQGTFFGSGVNVIPGSAFSYNGGTSAFYHQYAWNPSSGGTPSFVAENISLTLQNTASYSSYDWYGYYIDVSGGPSSGTHRLFCGKVGGVEKFGVDGSGNVRISGNLGVGNSAAATTLGSVVKKIQVFDASGNSLGYVPVYNSIT